MDTPLEALNRVVLERGIDAGAPPVTGAPLRDLVGEQLYREREYGDPRVQEPDLAQRGLAWARANYPTKPAAAEGES